MDFYQKFMKDTKRRKKLMYCSKCGAKAPDGTAFCQKCGAKLVADNTTTSAATENSNNSIPYVTPEDATSKKKKGKKWPVILGAIAGVLLLVIIIASIGGDDNSTEVKLSETYTNAEEGFSFKYASAWKPVSENNLSNYFDSSENYPLVFLANETEDGLNTAMVVSKFIVDQDAIDHLFINDDQFIATFDDDVTVKSTAVVELDGVPARKITYVNSDGIGYESYFYAVGSALYRIDFSWKGEDPGNLQRFFDAIIGSYVIDTSNVSSAPAAS